MASARTIKKYSAILSTLLESGNRDMERLLRLELTFWRNHLRQVSRRKKRTRRRRHMEER